MDSRSFTNTLDEDLLPEASTSRIMQESAQSEVIHDEHLGSSPEVTPNEGASGDSDTDEEDGMDGPSILKHSPPADLAAFEAAQARAGIIYISRIPPGMRPPKLRRLMSRHGQIGRSFLQQEGE